MSKSFNYFDRNTTILTKDGVKAICDVGHGNSIRVLTPDGWRSAHAFNAGSSDALLMKLKKHDSVAKMVVGDENTWLTVSGLIKQQAFHGMEVLTRNCRNNNVRSTKKYRDYNCFGYRFRVGNEGTGGDFVDADCPISLAENSLSEICAFSDGYMLRTMLMHRSDIDKYLVTVETLGDMEAEFVRHCLPLAGKPIISENKKKPLGAVFTVLYEPNTNTGWVIESVEPSEQMDAWYIRVSGGKSIVLANGVVAPSLR